MLSFYSLTALFTVSTWCVVHGGITAFFGQESCITLAPQIQEISLRECPATCFLNLSLAAIDSEQVPPGTNTYRCGANHTVWIVSSNPEAPIRGVFVQARLSTPEFGPTAQFLGELRTLNSDLRTVTCEQMGISLTNVDDEAKLSVAFSWIAPPASESVPVNVTFWFSVVVDSQEVYIRLNRTFIPDEGSCIQESTPFPPITLFSLPNGPIFTVEGEEVTVCVNKSGLDVQTFIVRIFTDDQLEQAIGNEDYEELDTELEFAPQDTIQCVTFGIFSDSIVEEPEVFEVAIQVDSLSAVAAPARVTVVISDGVCEFQCVAETFCIPQAYVCDGIEDCLYGNDETGCGLTSEPCDSDGEFRLRGGPTQREGLLEICYEGSFRPLYLFGVDVLDATAVCDELGFLGGGVWVNAWREYATVGRGLPLSISDCVGNVTNPISCNSAIIFEFEFHTADAGLRCQDEPACQHGSVRLVGGSQVEGVVQLCVNGVWGSIVSSWRFPEARVVCRMLGFNEYGALPIPWFSYAGRNDVIVAGRIDCSGNEESILDCFVSYQIEGTSSGGYLVGVRCDDLPEDGCSDGDVRLIGRDSVSSGQVEVCVDGSWGGVCDSNWDLYEAMVVCRQLNSPLDGLAEAFSLNDVGERQSPFVLDFLGCAGNESNLLDCPAEGERFRRQLNCFDAAGVSCAELPQIILIPPANEGVYDVEVGRNLGVSCNLEPNLYYPGIVHFTAYLVRDGEQILIGNTTGSDIFVTGDQVEPNGLYMCTAEHAAGSSTITFNINTIVPSGPRSLAYIRLSLPGRLIDSQEVENVLSIIESFLVLDGINPETSPGQQVVHCRSVSRTQVDVKRSRDRFECIIENYPPLQNNPTAVAERVVQYMESQTFSIPALNVSELGFCDAEQTGFGDMWPETEAGSTRTIPCEGGVRTRECSPNSNGPAQWLPPSQCTIMFNCRSESLSISPDLVCDGVGHCLRLEDEIDCPPIITGCDDGDIRLSLGLSDNDGVIEVCINGSWGGLCQNVFTVNDARVVCRQLGLPEGAVRLGNIQSLVPVHPLSLSCGGSEPSVLQCGLLGLSFQCDRFTRAAVQCREQVLCDDGDLRLVGGRNDEKEGNLEICFNGVWGSVCQNERDFYKSEAAVACRQLGYNPLGALPLPDEYLYYDRSTVQLLGYVDCNGNENLLTDCNTDLFGNSEYGSGANIGDSFDECDPVQIRCDDYPVGNCDHGSVRLINRPHRSEGILEVCINEEWGTLCFDESFGSNEAKVICRQLGFSPNEPIFYGKIVQFGESRVLTDSLLCNGSEPFLAECEIDSFQRECFSSESVYLLCPRPPSIYLSPPPPTDSGDTYVFEVGHDVDVQCRTEQSYPPPRVIGYRLGNVPNKTCEQSERDDFRLDAGSGGAQLSLAGDYRCRACNELGNATINFTVIVQGPEGEGSSSFLRLSAPVLDRLTVIIGTDFSQLDDQEVLDGLESLIVSTDVIEQEDGVQTVECRIATSNPEDVVALRDRYECNITTYPATDMVEQLVDRVAIELRREYVTLLFAEVRTSGTGFCGFEVDEREWGTYEWPETRGGITVSLRCELDESITVRRECLVDGIWNDPVYGNCALLVLEVGFCGFEVDEREWGTYEWPETRGGTTVSLRCELDESITVRRECLVDGIWNDPVYGNCALLVLEVGFCGFEVDEREWGTYEWPETRGGTTVSLGCELDESITVRRECLVDGIWNDPVYGNCVLLVDEVNEENVGEVTQEVAMAVQVVNQTEENAVIFREILLEAAALASNNISLVDEQIVESVTDTLGGLQDWPAEAVQADNTGAQIVQSFETITISLAQQENFTELQIEEENIAVRIERVDINDIVTGRSLSVSDEDGNLNAVAGNDSELAPDEIASGFLPLSLFEMFDDEFIPIVFAVFRTGSLFSIAGNQEDVEGLETMVGSPVVSLTAGVNQVFRDLPDPIIVNVRILVENYTNPRCVSYDFDQQVWVRDGCTTIQTEDSSNQITCECDHLTNFASLVDICSRTEEGGCGQSGDAQLALDIISIIGVDLSGLGLILTILTLLFFKKLRTRDASKFHIQLSLALLGMLLVFVIGIDRTDVFAGCVTVSVLIHYFTLVAVMWMGAEAILMFQKLVLVFVQITTRQIIIISLICWLVPVVPAVIPAAINPDLMVTDTDTNKFCFIGDVRVFFAAFLGPIFAILFFNAVIFIIVITVLIRHTHNKLGKTADTKKQRKSNIRLAISLFGVMFLFGLTWILAGFTISEASLAFQILFAIFNSLQGFFIFVFFCLLSADVRQLWLQMLTCGRYTKTTSSYSTGAKKAGQAKSKSGAKTASSALSQLPTSHYASESAVELSENPSSTFIGYDSFAPAMDDSVEEPNVLQNSSPAEEKKMRKKGTSKFGAFESMRVTVEFKDGQ